MEKKRIEVVVNKSWEFEPFYDALTNAVLRPEGLPLPNIVNPVPKDTYMEEPRAVINGMDNIQVVLRCVENMMDPDANKSDSYSKMKHMPDILDRDVADMIISVSTAESTPEVQGDDSKKSINGSVLCGGTFFMYDAKDLNEDPSKTYLEVKIFQSNTFPEELFEVLSGSASELSKAKFIPQRNAGTTDFLCRVDNRYASVGVINISNYALYAEADEKAYIAFNEYNKEAYNFPFVPVCIETTHGIVKMCAKNTPTLFVSPITDRYLHFDKDVTPIQNYIAGFNAGIAVGEMLVALDKYYGEHE
ncbi:MAG: hypothetical protein LUG52_02250 [Clostridia bacterium]|nr:hypothetical protein [Clostridia bacterium]